MYIPIWNLEKIYIYIFIYTQSILVFDTMQVLYWPVLGQIPFCRFDRRCKTCLDTKPVLYQGRFCSLTDVTVMFYIFWKLTWRSRHTCFRKAWANKPYTARAKSQDFSSNGTGLIIRSHSVDVVCSSTWLAKSFMTAFVFPYVWNSIRKYLFIACYFRHGGASAGSSWLDTSTNGQHTPNFTLISYSFSPMIKVHGAKGNWMRRAAINVSWAADSYKPLSMPGKCTLRAWAVWWPRSPTQSGIAKRLDTTLLKSPSRHQYHL